MSSVLGSLMTLHGPPVYAVIVLLVFLEAAAFVGLVVPGETAMLVAGVLAARGNLSLPLVLALGSAAAVAGDSVGYSIGHRFGPMIERSRVGRWVGTARWQRAHTYVESRGAWAVALGRWVGVLRALVPAVAGMTRMPYRRFLVANAIGGVLWVATVVGVGYAAGGSLAVAQQVLGNFSLVGVLVTLALVLGALAGGWWRRRRPSRQTTPADDGVLARLHQGLLGASVVLGIASLAVVELADGVRERSDLAAYDPTVTAEVVSGRNGALTPLAEIVTFFGSTVSLGVFTVVLLLWLGVRQRARGVAATVAGAMAASAALTLLLKDVVGRARPPAGTVLGVVDPSYAFPSGHTLNSTVFLGLVASIAFTRTSSVPVRLGIVLAWLGGSVAVGLSRIYLGYHWMTDVMAGFGAGVAVLAATAMVTVLLGLRRRHGVTPVAMSGQEA